MPGMKLDFLKNPHQRVATGKSLPLKQVEAIVLYGRPEQRAKVIEKLLPSTYGLSLNKQTHHVLLTLLDHADNLARVNMLYNVRRKILDLCSSPVGNVVLQKMIERVPTRQRREIAEAFVLNVEPDEFRRLCEHPFGNHVAQKLIEYPECAELVCPQGLVPFLHELATHAYGMRVVAKYVESVKGGWKRTIAALIPGTPIDTLVTDDNDKDVDDDDDDMPANEAFLEESVSKAVDAGVTRLFAAQDESMVVAALLKSLLVPSAFKDAIVAHLAEYASEYLNPKPTNTMEASNKEKQHDDGDYAMPDFGSAAAPSSSPTAAGADGENKPLKPRHVHAFCAVFQEGDPAQRKTLWDAIASDSDVIAKLVATLAASPVAVAATRFVEESRSPLYAALFLQPAAEDEDKTKKQSKKLSVCEVAEDTVRTLLLRTFIDVDCERVTKAQRTQLSKEAVRLSQSPTASPVLQKLLESDPSHGVAALMYKAVQKALPELVSHQCGSFFVQALLQFSDEAVRAKLAEDLWGVLGADLQKTLAYAQGSRVMQKLLAYAPDEVVVDAVSQLVERATEEAEEVAGDDNDDDDDEEDEDEEQEGASDDDNDDKKEEKEEKEEDEEEPKKPLSRMEQIAANRQKHYGVRSNAVADFALHNHACYVIQALLRETRSRQLEKERKQLMSELKPHVFDLAVSPWSGRVVLDTMMQSGSAQLTEAMKNVVFLKAEAWLSTISDAKKQRGAGIDATTRETLKRQRELNGNGGNKSSHHVNNNKGRNDRPPARRAHA